MGSVGVSYPKPSGKERSFASEAPLQNGDYRGSGEDICISGPVPIDCRFDPDEFVAEYYRNEGYVSENIGHEAEASIIESDECDYLKDLMPEEQIVRAKELAARLCRSEYGPSDHFLNYFTADPVERQAIQTILTRCRTVMEIRMAVQIHEVFRHSEPRFRIDPRGRCCHICRQFERSEYTLGDNDRRYPPFCLGCRCRLSMTPLPKLE